MARQFHWLLGLGVTMLVAIVGVVLLSKKDLK